MVYEPESHENSYGQKIGAGSSDPNRRSQPRLPGSVVGKPSMLQCCFLDKITEVIVLKLPGDRRYLCAYFAATNECVIACTESAMRFCTPTLRINFAT
jgi:hypothetical protein